MTEAAAHADRPFNLRALAREVAAESESADPKVIATEVLARIPARYLRDALAETLPDYVRISLHRRAAGPFPLTVVPPDGQATSWKVQGAQAYGRLLRQAVDVKGDGSGWKHLADCTTEDLNAVAALRRAQAHDLITTASWYEKIAGLLDEYEAATVAALPEPVLHALAEGS